ncbi:hypothetical protein SAMD00019534_048830 [Acytostelium subglobosum LB1]|uniref:hypothetical protein n=1 Tax=Acytostelium subglobosum LB1 TaxID=1410327 RepID=UPI000644A322|nr:hypothetical protein SAMD00019534_048830 [Acytostelium subglobosum LB1]GAM21708.1 hypothetical protein SAMD00019534_048830 [Acytostelium subglobosum LB1]|eukprot:XP_012755827.1 hypothetical protein SAMD00019534_048830 [Acytostelium subglobosum LB1]
MDSSSDSLDHNSGVGKHHAQFEIGGLLIELCVSFWKSRSLFVAAKLDLAVHLLDGSKSVEVLAELVGANKESLFRLMRALSTIDIFEQVSPRVFANTPISHHLAVNRDIHAVIVSEGNDNNYRLWESFCDTVKSGKTNSVERVFGVPTMWMAMQADPKYEEDFKKSMTALTNFKVPHLAGLYDYSKFDTVVDIGGSEGILMAELLRRYPNIKKGINFDTPTVISNNKRRGLRHSDDERYHDVGGDFFEHVPEADCFVLKQILHDWNDQCCRDILQCLYRSLRPYGQICIYDSIVERESPVYGQACWVDLHMMQLIDGKERSEAEWRDLAESAGFKVDKLIANELVVLTKKHSLQ